MNSDTRHDRSLDVGRFIRHNPYIASLGIFLLGLLLIVISREGLSSAVALPETLYGDNPITSLGVLLTAAAPVFSACHFLRRKEVDWFSIVIFILAAIVSLHYIHISNNYAYTNDLRWHLRYIQYVQDNWQRPYHYSTSTDTHPPLYYYFASTVKQLSEMSGSVPYMTGLRFLSWTFFLIFNVFNLLTLRCVKLSGIIYYVCAALLLLWPGNAHLASKINSEAMYYAVAAISFYYTIIWYQEGKQWALRRSIIAAGVALTIRGNAVIVFTFLGMLILITLLRKRMAWRDFISVQWIKATLILLVCGLFGLAGLVIHNHTASAYVPNIRPSFPLVDYFSLKYTLSVPFNNWDLKLGFLEYFLRTSIFAEYAWPSPQFAITLNFLSFVIFWYSALPWLVASRKQWQGMLPHILYLWTALLWAFYFALFVQDNASRDFRYIYPVLICGVVLFGKAQVFYREKEMLVLSWAGTMLAVIFVTLSTYFFWNNAR